MPTSGTYAFGMTRDTLIASSLRLLGAYDPDTPIPAADITNCAEALNILVKELVIGGLPLWCVADMAVPMVAGQTSYLLSSPTVGTPLRILKCYIRDSAGNDTNITLVAHSDYLLLGQKTAQGTPNQAYYDPQVGAGTITLYSVPSDATMTLHVLYQRQIQDFNLATDNPDFPPEAFRLLRWCLADEVSLEYQATPDVRKEVNEKAMALKLKFLAWEQEQVSVFFQPRFY